MNKSYTREDWERFLQSGEVSTEFRKRIEAALKDGSQSALESLGFAHSVMSNIEAVDRDSQKVPEL